MWWPCRNHRNRSRTRVFQSLGYQAIAKRQANGVFSTVGVTIAALSNRVHGFCTDAETEAFFEQRRAALEKMLVDDGAASVQILLIVAAANSCADAAREHDR